MLSRVADAIYWMSRYVERAENVARVVDVKLSLAIDVPEADEHWLPLVQATGDEETFVARYGAEATRENVLRFLSFDRDAPNSILSLLTKARENARTVREIISSDIWEQLNHSYLMVRDAASSDGILDAPHDLFTQIKQASQLFVGVTYLTMTHNEAWHFARVGRLAERAGQTARILHLKHFMRSAEPSITDSAFDEIQWQALLRSASAFEMYRKRFGQVVPDRVLEFLLFSRRFPRSVRYCVRKAERSLHAITGVPLGTAGTLAERELGRLAAELDYGEVAEVLSTGLHLWLETFQVRLDKAAAAIESSFFGHAPPANEDPRSSVILLGGQRQF